MTIEASPSTQRLNDGAAPAAAPAIGEVGGVAAGIHPRPSFWRSLAGRLLVLAVVFVFISEIIIYIPSISRYRIDWLKGRIDSSYVALLTLEAGGSPVIEFTWQREILATAGVYALSVKRDGMHEQVLGMPAAGSRNPIIQNIDEPAPFVSILNAFRTMMIRGDEIQIAEGRPHGEAEELEIVVSANDLKADMLDYSWRILGLTIFISATVASLLYAVLLISFVRPMRRFTLAMIEFQREPQDPERIIEPHARHDEIGEAERVLADMQREIRTALRQRERLAALGEAVSKINHDLRNILASAQLVSDRMSRSEDPRVQRLAPKLVKALDRAVELCRNTARYGAPEAQGAREMFPLLDIVEEAAPEAPRGRDGVVRYVNEIDPDFQVFAAREQVFRILSNIVSNAAQAILDGGDEKGGDIRISAMRHGRCVMIEIADTGPGLPDKARANLFKPFKASTKPGGAGLGLAIARELAQAHDGDVTLVETSAAGTTFRVEISEPARP